MNTPPTNPVQTSDSHVEKHGGRDAMLEIKWEGDIPPPGVLRGYEELIPGSAERMLKATEDTAAHRHKTEIISLQESVRAYRRGQWMGIVSVLAGLGTCAYTATIGATGVAAIVGGATLVGVATVFVVGRKSSSQEDDGSS